MDALERGFHRFLDGVRSGGARIACADDPRLRDYAAKRTGTLTYSACGNAASWECRDLRSQGWGSTGRIFLEGREVASLDLRVPGVHNVQDALGATAAACAAGLDPERAAGQLTSFRGVKRRLERIGEFGGVLVLDDFAHHPAKIKASIAAVKSVLPGRQITVVFQPHRYSRTRLLREEFGKALSAADKVYVTGIYAGPGEAEEAGVSSALIRDAVKALGSTVHLIEDMDEAAVEAAKASRPGDVILTIGAGDVWKTHGAIGEVLATRQ
jgi:UDP-N-acetylmuramate--alanine ligase